VTECFMFHDPCTDTYTVVWFKQLMLIAPPASRPTADTCLPLFDRTMTADDLRTTLKTCLPVPDPSHPPTGRGLTKLLAGAYL